eukprot:CAMPEP_0179148194 /NCGR_PEP_ID=MMETSP0796-20121207/71697_1 /TAXON_ID=73915 /ORGANISM="Pyrodinium bahamense, Strain pbaha01" /LENGTH=36 /DNA_ID= /DNA_START= /DNA_END= /DNA_ORIENTATION=
MPGPRSAQQMYMYKGFQRLPQAINSGLTQQHPETFN